MWKQGWMRVISEEPIEGQSVPLVSVLDCNEWIEATKASELHSHFLTNLSYDEFVANKASRVLSYRWANKIQLKECPVRDPANVVSSFSGDIALSVLETPLTGWKYLWADALNHLNDPDGREHSLMTMGNLYLKCITLPQYFRLKGGNMDQLKDAIKRGWMHQELAYGELDSKLVYEGIMLCALSMPDVWRGNPFYLPSIQVLSIFLAKRIRAGVTEVWNSNPPKTLLQHVQHLLGLCYYVHHGKPSRLGWIVNGEAQKNARDMAKCKRMIDEFVSLVSIKQVSSDPAENLHMLNTNVLTCWSILRSATNAIYWDKADAYYASTAVIAAASGLVVLDPLATYKKSDRKQTNPDGTLKFTYQDLDLDVLNQSNEILRLCWKTISTTPNAWGMIPYAMRGMSGEEMAVIKEEHLPPGMHTVGAGPIPKAPACIRVVSPNTDPECSGIGFQTEECIDSSMGYDCRTDEWCLCFMLKKPTNVELRTFSLADFENQEMRQSTYNLC